jgi:CRISPR/Cas system-associated endonuclease/helicase Cas3
MSDNANNKHLQTSPLFHALTKAQSNRQKKKLLSKASHHNLSKLAKVLYDVNGDPDVADALTPEERSLLKTLRFRRQKNIFNRNLKSVKKLRQLKKSPFKLQKILYSLVPLIHFLGAVVSRL